MGQTGKGKKSSTSAPNDQGDNAKASPPPLSPEEVAAIKEVIHGLNNPENHHHFIQELALYTQILRRELSYPSQGSLWDETKRNVARLRKARDVIHSYCTLKAIPIIPGDGDMAKLYDWRHSIAQLDRGPSEEWKEVLEIQPLAFAVLRPLDQFIEHLGNLPIKSVRGKRDKDRRVSSFVNTVARLFADHITMPTTTIYGPFWEVICITLRAAGLPATDPRRHIARAVKDVRSGDSTKIR